jgi:uncharacterized protein YcbK (DUF882 family)
MSGRFAGCVSLTSRLVALILTCASTATLTGPAGLSEARVSHSAGLATRKGPAQESTNDLPVLATLEEVHGGTRMVLDAESPSPQRFAALLSDRLTGERHPIDERLLALIRSLAELHPGGRVELVSGYRSWKTNERMRKKGHRVSAHSQHSLGNACDFRIVPAGADQVVALDPHVVEIEIRKLGWVGGVGVYPATTDWFVHADVGRNRRWED